VSSAGADIESPSAEADNSPTAKGDFTMANIFSQAADLSTNTAVLGASPAYALLRRTSETQPEAVSALSLAAAICLLLLARAAFKSALLLKPIRVREMAASSKAA
jgi:hypothetical protein